MAPPTDSRTLVCNNVRWLAKSETAPTSGALQKKHGGLHPTSNIYIFNWIQDHVSLESMLNNLFAIIDHFGFIMKHKIKRDMWSEVEHFCVNIHSKRESMKTHWLF